MNSMDNLNTLYEAYDTCEDTMMILDAYDEYTFDYIDNYMIQHESIFSKTKNFTKSHGGFLGTLKYIGNYALDFLRKLWKTFTGYAGKFISKLINFVKRNRDKNDNLPSKVYSYQISFDNKSLRSTIDKVSSKSFLHNRFFSAIGTIAKNIKKFATEQIDSLVRFISDIFKRFRSNTESVLIYKSEYFTNEAGRSFTLNDIRLDDNDFASIYSRTDRIDVNNRMLHQLDDMHYKIILESENVVKAYNCFIAKKYTEYNNRANEIRIEKDKFNAWLRKNALPEDIYVGKDGKKYLKPALEKFRDAYQKLYETLYPDRTEYGNSVLGIVAEINDKPTRSLQDKLVGDIVDNQNIFFPDLNIDEDVRTEQIKTEIQLRLNYNVNMRKILSNIIKLNYAFFKLSEAEANVISTSIIEETKNSSAIHKALDLVKGATKQFIEYPGKLNFNKIGAGIVYYSTELFDLKLPERDASSVLPMAMRYDYVISSHGKSNSVERWKMCSVNIEGLITDDVNKAVYQIIKKIDTDRKVNHTGNKPVKIFIDVCNETFFGEFAIDDSIKELVKKKNILLVFPNSSLDSPENFDVATRMHDIGYK